MWLAKGTGKIKLVNSESGHIKVNIPTLQEILRTREEDLFSHNHPILEISGTKPTLSNLLFWNFHIQNFMTQYFQEIRYNLHFRDKNKQ